MTLRTTGGRLRVNGGKLRTTGGGGTVTPPTCATTFATTLSPTTGQANTAASYTVTPGSGGFPGGKTVQPQVSGFGTPSAQTTTAGSTAALTFVLAATGAGGTTATVNVAIDGMANQTGQQSFAITQAPVVPSGAANRFDLVMDQSSVAPGAAATGNAYPNGTWGGGTATLTPSAGGSAMTLTLPSSGNAAVPFSFTPSAAGEIDLVPSNTAGLYNPLPARLTVFAGSSGTARSLAVASARADHAGFLYSRLGAKPRGFGIGVGFGPVWFNITALGGATDGVWARLYSGGSTAVGSGIELTSGPVQIHGPVSSPGMIRVMLPALPTETYVDLATDAAFTNPARVSQRLCVGLVMAHASRSQETGMERAYASAGQSIGVSYAKAAASVGYDARYGNSSGNWFVHDGVSTDPDPNHDGQDSSAALMEFGRLVEARLGVLTRVTGIAGSGGGIDQYVNHDGSFYNYPGTQAPFDSTVAASIGREFRWFWGALAGWDQVSSSYPAQYPTEGPARLSALPAKIAATYPSCAVVALNTGDSGWYGSNGSQQYGERRDGAMLRDQAAANPMLISRTDMIWNEFRGSHATQGARIYYARQGLQAMLDVELAAMGGNQSASRGPRLGMTGTWNKSTNVLSIPYQLHGGTALSAIGVSFSSPSSTVGSATSAEVASLFGVYPAGQGWGNGRAVQISSATINASAGTIDLALVVSGGALVNGIDSNNQNFGSGTQAMPSGFSVHFGDFGASNRSLYPAWMGGPTRSAALVDDHDDLGLGYGRQMMPQLDIAVS